MTKKEKLILIDNVYDILNKTYPNAKCALHFTTDYELLFATRLSAQCTDERVNIITKTLFERYKNLEEYKNADYNEMCKIIYSSGFYKAKAQNIIDCANDLIEKHNSIVPDNIQELVKLPGVGRKTANLIIGDLYGKSAIIADTHLIRLTNRLGLVKTTDPTKVEYELKKIIPEEKQTKFCHLMVWHGRNRCKSQRPDCDGCEIGYICPKIIKKKK